MSKAEKVTTIRLRSFENGMKVRYVGDEYQELKGKTGVVTRILIRDWSAWVAMDGGLPERLQRFPADDPRGSHINLWPEDCERV
jgi:hypothetical protein